MKDKQKLGKKGEAIAEDYLVSEKYEIVAKNWRYSRSEIDLIARHNGVLIFIEVKTVSSEGLMPPEAKVGKVKQRRIVDAANRYMEEAGHDGEIRFDIISIRMHGSSGHTLRHFRDAFFPGLAP